MISARVSRKGRKGAKNAALAAPSLPPREIHLTPFFKNPAVFFSGLPENLLPSAITR